MFAATIVLIKSWTEEIHKFVLLDTIVHHADFHYTCLWWPQSL